MNLLLTGSNGYIGSQFQKEFGTHYNISTFSFLKSDLNNIVLSEIDAIVHLAALVHQKKNLSYEDYYKINVGYPLKLAAKAKQAGVAHFVFISSIAVYGDTPGLIDEHTHCNPQTFYGQSKLEAEKQLLALENETFTISIIRTPMVYGKNAPGNVNSLVKLVRKMPIIPLGNINNKRSFIYVSNLCHLINEIIRQTKHGIFLASDNEALSTSRLIELIAQNLDKKNYLVKIPFLESLFKLLEPSFHKKLYGSLEIDNSFTRRKLNLINPYSVEEGIKLMLCNKV